MRAIVPATTFVLCAALAACNPYDPNLPPTPFRCGTTDPVCPSGYACDGTVCVESSGGPDGGDHSDGGCADPAEPNNTTPEATNGAVWDQRTDIVFEGLTLCPMMDTDLYHLNQPVTCGAAPACPNLDVIVDYEDLAVTPAVAVLNSAGTPVAMGGPTGTSGQIKAVFNNVAQGQYYVRVTAQAVLNHYKLTIDGRRTQ